MKPQSLQSSDAKCDDSESSTWSSDHRTGGLSCEFSAGIQAFPFAAARPFPAGCEDRLHTPYKC